MNSLCAVVSLSPSWKPCLLLHLVISVFFRFIIYFLFQWFFIQAAQYTHDWLNQHPRGGAQRAVWFESAFGSVECRRPGDHCCACTVGSPLAPLPSAFSPFSLLSHRPPLPSAFSYVHIALAYAASTGHHFSNGHQDLSWPWLPGRLCPLILTVFSVLVSGADVWTSGIITEGALPPLEMPYVHAVLDNWSVTKCPLCCVSPKSSLTECRRRVCFLWGMWWVEVFRRLLGADYFCYGFSGWRVFTTFWVNSLWDLASVS